MNLYNHNVFIISCEHLNISISFLSKIVKVTDGDTVKGVLCLDKDNFTKFIFRLNGIDTPETRKGEVK